jgi:hypothetical protein
MDAGNIRAFLDEALDRQRDAIRLQTGYAAAIVTIGVAVVVLVHLLTSFAATESLKWLVTVGGGFISTLSGFPVQQIIAARDRTAALQLLKRLAAAADPQQPLDAQLEQRFWKLFDKALGV